MGRAPRRVYAAEFRQRAVELIVRDGLGIAEASRRLAISPKTLTDRVSRAKGGDSLEAGATPRRSVTEEEAELSRLRGGNAELRVERDILKKAGAYFARESLRATR